MTRGFGRAARQAHRLCLVAYPRWFRRQFGRELARVFDTRLTAAAPPWRLLLAAYLIADVIASGLAERLRELRPFAGTPPPRPASRSVSMVWQSIVADARLAVRRLLQAPTFAVVAILSLGLGIGANAALFSLVYGVLLKPLAYENPDRLVMIWSHNTRQHEPGNPVSPANFEAFRAAPSLARAEALYSFMIRHLVRAGGEPDPALAATVTPGLFDLLGRPALVGRTFHEGDSPHVVVLSHAYWQRRFGGDPAVVGRAIPIGNVTTPATILGVMPPDFVFPYQSMLWPPTFTRPLEADMWKPLTRDTDARLVDAGGQPNRTIHYLGVVARLAPGATFDRARAALEAIARARAAEFPDTNDGWGITVRPLHEQAIGVVRRPLLTLLTAVGVVLLITCINLANVLLARANSRRGELAVRGALGASRPRLVQQMLVESLVVAMAGGVAGFGIMQAGSQALLAMAPHMPRLAEARSDWMAAAVVAALAVAVGLVLGLLPALTAIRPQAQDSLREVHRTTASRARQRVRAALIVGEVAMAMVLTVGTGLLLRSFVAVMNVEPGFSPERLLTLQTAIPSRLRSMDDYLAYYDDLEARLRALPGVTHVGGTTRLPLGSTNVTTMVDVDGRGVPVADRPEVELRRAVFDFFGTMGIPLLRGRVFGRNDGAGVPLVAVVNTAFVDRVFPTEDPVGRRVRIGSNPNAAWITIVGIVGSVKHGSLEEAPRPELYLHYRQGVVNSPFIALRTNGDPASLAAPVREVIRGLGGDPPTSVHTMEDLRHASVGERRFVLVLTAIFGVLAVGLAAIGVYGVIALVAAERSREVGIRLALGATPPAVLRLLLGQASRLAGLGVAAGAVAALLMTPALGSQLFGVASADPATYLAVAGVLVGTALLAAFGPARRAMRTDPAQSLRQ